MSWRGKGWIARHAAARMILRDPLGKESDSERFSTILDAVAMQGQDLVFLISGHDGLTKTSASGGIMAEQIYRGFAILKNHPYVR